MKGWKFYLLVLLVAASGCRKVETKSYSPGLTLPLPDMVILRNIKRRIGDKEGLIRWQHCIVKFNFTNPSDTPYVIYPALNPLYTDSADYEIDISCPFMGLEIIAPHSSKQLVFYHGYKRDKYRDFDTLIDYISMWPQGPCSYFKSKSEAESYFSLEKNCEVVFYKNFHPTIITLNKPVIFCDTIHEKRKSHFLYDFWTPMDSCYANYYR